MKKVELKNYINEQLKSVNDVLGKHILSVKQLPNHLYMAEPNQREMRWNDIDTEVYQILDELFTKLNSLLEKTNNIK
jgi:hypothetical protein